MALNIEMHTMHAKVVHRIVNAVIRKCLYIRTVMERLILTVRKFAMHVMRMKANIMQALINAGIPIYLQRFYDNR